MAATQIIQVFNLIDSNNPVLARESLLKRAQFWALRWEFRTTDAILRLARREERVVVVVRHLVHEAVAHGRRGFVVDAVFAAGGEEVAFFDFVGPDAWKKV